MKIPESPPPFDRLMQDLLVNNTNRAGSVLGKMLPSPTDEKRYLHWDEMRFRQPPTGLSLEEWWLITKLKRSSIADTIPLKDKTGSPFRWATISLLAEKLQRIDTCLGGARELPETVSNAATRDRYLVRGLLEESITSSQLEGAVTTRDIAKQLIRSGRSPRDKSERMILNNYQTMRMIRDIADEPLSPQTVFDLHRRITEGTLDDPGAAGRFRTEKERIQVADLEDNVFHNPPLASELLGRLNSMCDFANGKTPDRYVHPVVRAVMLHFWLAYDHPFVDGNGRLARALFYWMMIRNRYWLCEFISISHVLLQAPTKYYLAFLHTETDDNDLTYFLLHQLDVLLTAMEELDTYINRKTQRMAALRNRLRGLNSLNHRQIALIDHALGHPDERYTIEVHQTSHGVVYETARSDLMDLMKRGLLTATKIGRTYHFRPMPDLEQRLMAIE